jgi:hypothetical protein
MSDVVVSVVESNTAVTVTEQDVAVDVTENNVVVSVSTAGIQGVPGANNDPTYVTVRNATGATLAKGTIVYISGANGNNVQVSKAIATGDSTSARTIGWLAASIPNNGSGLCMVEGYLEGLNTQGFTAGAQLYLSGTVAGGFTATKPVAPIHLVYVGVVTKISAGDGHVFVKVQNGYELDELHNVLITSPTNNQVLAYDSATQLWKNATNTPDGVTSITATAPLTGGTITSTGSIGLDQTALSITKSQVSDFTSGTVTSASTAQQAGTAVYATTSGTAVFATNASTAVNLSGSITKSQVSDFTSGTVASAGTAQQSGTAVFANTSGTATYATTSGTAVTISGDITKSQVSDFASGTVASASTAQQSGTAVFANTSGTATFATTSGTATFATNASTAVTISGSITQSQVTNLVTDLANTAKLNTANTFTVGGHVINNGATGTVPIRLNAITGQTANQMEFYNASGVLSSRIAADGAYVAGANSESFISGASFRLQITPASAATVAATIRGASGQSANLQVWTDNANNVLASVNSAGLLNLTRALTLIQTNAGEYGIRVRGASGQSADLLQLQNSAGTNLLRADQFGGLFSTYATFTSDAAGTRPLLVRGASGQTANLFEIQTSGASTLFRVDSAGSVFTGAQSITIPGTVGTNALRMRSTTDGVGNLVNLRFESSNGNLFDMGKNEVSSQQGSFYLYTGSALPIELYNSAVKRLIIESTGNVNIGPTTGAGFARLTVFNDTATRVASAIRGAASQSANLQEWQSSAGVILARVDSVGDITARVSRSTFAARYTTTDPSIAIQVNTGAASQTGDVMQYQSSTGTVLGGRNGVGQIYTGSTAPIALTVGGATTATSGTGSVATVTTTSTHNLGTGDRVTIAGITPTGYNGTYIVTSTPTTTSFTYANATTGAQTVAGTVSLDAQASITARSAATFPLVIRGATSQNSDLTIWQNAAGSTLARINPTGIVIGAGFQGSGLLNTSGQTSLVVSSNRNIGLAGSTADFGAGQSVVFISNAAVVPSANPTGGGILYVEAGALKFRGSSGTITTIANA